MPAFVIKHALRKSMDVLGWLVYALCVLGSAVVSVWTVVLSQSARARAAMSRVEAPPAKTESSEVSAVEETDAARTKEDSRPQASAPGKPDARDEPSAEDS